MVKPAFLAELPRLQCSRLAEPYPPPDLYTCESDEIYACNAAFIHQDAPKDFRKLHKFAVQIDPPALTHDLSPDQSALFIDENNALVAVVIRNACRDGRVLDFIDEAVKDVVNTRVNIRVSYSSIALNSVLTTCPQKENMGHMSQMGLSAGSLSKVFLDWVWNIRIQKNNYAEHQNVNVSASSAFAVLWSLACTLLPEEIIQDYLDFIELVGIHRMDARGEMDPDQDGHGTYTIKIGGKDFEFHDAELTPPTGVMEENYCRCSFLCFITF